MKEIDIDGIKYTLIKNEKDGFDEEAFRERLTDYFDAFDIVVGDWAYGQLRLKGFNEKGNKEFKDINDADKIEEYIKTYCAFGCKWFAVKRKGPAKKISNEEKKTENKQKS